MIKIKHVHIYLSSDEGRELDEEHIDELQREIEDLEAAYIKLKSLNNQQALTIGELNEKIASLEDEILGLNRLEDEGDQW